MWLRLPHPVCNLAAVHPRHCVVENRQPGSVPWRRPLSPDLPSSAVSTRYPSPLEQDLADLEAHHFIVDTQDQSRPLRHTSASWRQSGEGAGPRGPTHRIPSSVQRPGNPMKRIADLALPRDLLDVRTRYRAARLLLRREGCSAPKKDQSIESAADDRCFRG